MESNASGSGPRKSIATTWGRSGQHGLDPVERSAIRRQAMHADDEPTARGQSDLLGVGYFWSEQSVPEVPKT